MNRQSLLAYLAILATISAFFGPAVMSGRPLLFRDSAHFYYPLFEWCSREWSAGRVPLWNPYENCGTPVLADATSSVLYPGKLIFALPLTYGTCFNLYIVLHVVLAAASCFVTARHWRVSPSSAALAAIGYSCGGAVLIQYCNVVFLVGAAWLPLSLLFVDRMLRVGNSTAAIGLGAVLALMILGGDPQTAYHSLLAAGLYVGVLGWWAKRENALSQPKLWLTRIGVCSIAALVALCLSAAQIWPSIEATSRSDRSASNFPRNIYEAASAALQTQIGEHGGAETRAKAIATGLFSEPETFTHHEAVYEFSVGPWRLAEFLWPNIGGRLFPQNRRWFSLLPGEGRVWIPTLYLGLLPVSLALGALCSIASNSREAWLKWLFVSSLVASLGCYGLGWLVRECAAALHIESQWTQAIGNPVGGLYWLLTTVLPGYVYFRYPAKWLTVTAFAICLVAAKAFDRAVTRRETWIPVVLLFLAIGSCLAELVFWAFGGHVFASATATDSTLGPFDAAAARHDILFALLQSSLVAGLLAVLTYFAATQPNYKAHFKWIIVLLTAADIWAANAWTVVAVDPNCVRGQSPLVSHVQSEHASAISESQSPRVFRGNLATWRPPSFRTTKSSDRLSELVHWEHQTLLPKFPLQHDICVVETHGSITSADYHGLLYVAKQHGPRQSDKSLTPQPTVLRLLATEFLVLPENHQVEFATRAVSASAHWPESAALWQLNRTQPRCWIVHDVQTMPELKEPRRIQTIQERARAVLFPDGKSRDFTRQAVVETDQPAQPWTQNFNSYADPTNMAAPNSRITHESPQRVVVEAELQQPGLLVLADAYYPGWKATVTTGTETRPVPIYRTNRVLRGVRLAAGKQTVEFRYQPRTFYAGAIVSVISWLALAAFALRRCIRKRNPFPI